LYSVPLAVGAVAVTDTWPPSCVSASSRYEHVNVRQEGALLHTFRTALALPQGSSGMATLYLHAGSRTTRLACLLVFENGLKVSAFSGTIRKIARIVELLVATTLPFHGCGHARCTGDARAWPQEIRFIDEVRTQPLRDLHRIFVARVDSSHGWTADTPTPPVPCSTTTASAAHAYDQQKDERELNRAKEIDQGQRPSGRRPVDWLKHVKHRSREAEHQRKSTTRRCGRRGDRYIVCRSRPKRASGERSRRGDKHNVGWGHGRGRQRHGWWARPMPRVLTIPRTTRTWWSRRSPISFSRQRRRRWKRGILVYKEGSCRHVRRWRRG